MTKDFSKHLFLFLSKSPFQESQSASQIISSIKVPDRQFPRSVFVYDHDSICLGYFASYEDHFTDDQIFTYCKKGLWKEMVKKIADYLIIFIDCHNHKINILTSLTGKIPCFYSVENNQIIISTSFHLVDENLKKRTLCIEEALEFLVWRQSVYPREETLYNQINQLPPATLLTVDRNFNVVSEPLLTIDEILEDGRKPLFLDNNDFINEFMRMGKVVMDDYLKTVGEVDFSLELSSGFDSSLVAYWLKKSTLQPFVCYSTFSPLIYEDSHPGIVNKFSNLHGLTTKFIDITDHFPFANLKNISDARHNFYITDYGFEKISYGYSCISDSGKKETALFTGHGGDELYHSFALENTLRFGVQGTYFDLLSYSNSWLNSVLTIRGVDILTSKKRFSQKRIYPSPASFSVSVLGQMYFPLFWESGVWPLTPLDDPRLMNVCRRMPKSLQNEDNIKLKLCSLMRNVFIKEQFVTKGGPDKLHHRFLTERTDLVISVLKKSILGELGLIKNIELIKELENKNSSFFANLEIPLFLQALIQLEIFLQKSDL